MRRFWTDAEHALFMAEYPNTPTKALAAKLDRSERAVYMRADQFGLNKTTEYLASPESGRRQVGYGPTSTSFKPGLVPWNAGRKGWKAGGRANETRFKPGQMPHNHRPVGHERISKDGHLERKVAEPKTFRSVHVLVWETANGPVPNGHAVAFLPGRKSTVASEITPDALELVSRAELMRRNSYHNYPQPIPRLIQLRGALQRQINKRASA